MAVRVQDWSDYDWFIRTYIPRQTIPTLRNFADQIQNATGTWLGVRSSERKADLVHKVENAFHSMKKFGNLDMYSRVRFACESHGQPVPRPYAMPPQPAPTFGGVPAHASSSYAAPMQSAAAGPSRAGGSGWGSTSGTPTFYSRPGAGLQDWKPNPLWKPIKALTNMDSLPDISATENSHVRREKKIHFTLPNDVIEKLSYAKSNPNAVPQYSVRLFCTSSDYYKPPGTPYVSTNAHITNSLIPIEYPSAPDIHVDEYPISFKERGLRGKAGSAPPFDINKSSRGLNLTPGRLMTVAFGHVGPTVGKKKEQSKRFFFQIVFIEWTPKEALLERLTRKVPTDTEEALALAKKRAEENDDIEVGTSNMTLKDPLSIMRITTPIRSKQCTHLQCFDARWWIESNAVHPQWLCPLCNKELRFDDLIVDGFFLDILNQVPEDIEEVVLEGDGIWHTEDGKYGSRSWLAAQSNPAVPATPLINGHAKPETREPSRAPSASESPESRGKRKAIEVLSSDDEDKGPSQLSNGHAPPRPAPNRTTSTTSVNGGPSRQPAISSSSRQLSRPPSVQPTACATVIDLTLSSDDEDEALSNAVDTYEDDNDDDEEDVVLPPFRNPGAGYASRGVADSLPPLPLPTLNSNGHRMNGGPAARYPGADPYDWDRPFDPPYGAQGVYPVEGTFFGDAAAFGQDLAGRKRRREESGDSSGSGGGNALRGAGSGGWGNGYRLIEATDQSHFSCKQSKTPRPSSAFKESKLGRTHIFSLGKRCNLKGEAASDVRHHQDAPLDSSSLSQTHKPSALAKRDARPISAGVAAQMPPYIMRPAAPIFGRPATPALAHLLSRHTRFRSEHADLNVSCGLQIRGLTRPILDKDSGLYRAQDVQSGRTAGESSQPAHPHCEVEQSRLHSNSYLPEKRHGGDCIRNVEAGDEEDMVIAEAERFDDNDDEAAWEEAWHAFINNASESSVSKGGLPVETPSERPVDVIAKEQAGYVDMAQGLVPASRCTGLDTAGRVGGERAVNTSGTLDARDPGGRRAAEAIYGAEERPDAQASGEVRGLAASQGGSDAEGEDGPGTAGTADGWEDEEGDSLELVERDL